MLFAIAYAFLANIYRKIKKFQYCKYFEDVRLKNNCINSLNIH